VLNSDLRKLAVNMGELFLAKTQAEHKCPSPVCTFSPLDTLPLLPPARARSKYVVLLNAQYHTPSLTKQASNVQQLTAALLQKRSLLAAVDPALGKYLTMSIAYRGKLSMRDSECREASSGH
jgi:hypothetical protein